MDKVWTVWISSEDTNPILVGIATTESIAEEMKATVEDEFDDTFKCEISCMDTNKMVMNDKDILFYNLNKNGNAPCLK